MSERSYKFTAPLTALFPRTCEFSLSRSSLFLISDTCSLSIMRIFPFAVRRGGSLLFLQTISTASAIFYSFIIHGETIVFVCVWPGRDAYVEYWYTRRARFYFWDIFEAVEAVRDCSVSWCACRIGFCNDRTVAWRTDGLFCTRWAVNVMGFLYRILLYAVCYSYWSIIYFNEKRLNRIKTLC